MIVYQFLRSINSSETRITAIGAEEQGSQAKHQWQRRDHLVEQSVERSLSIPLSRTNYVSISALYRRSSNMYPRHMSRVQRRMSNTTTLHVLSPYTAKKYHFLGTRLALRLSCSLVTRLGRLPPPATKLDFRMPSFSSALPFRSAWGRPVSGSMIALPRLAAWTRSGFSSTRIL